MDSEIFAPEEATTTKPKEKSKQKTRRFPPYNVILKNDDFHSFEFVVQVLQKAISVSEQQAFVLTHEAHESGRAIIWTGPKEVAEFKVEQISTFHETRDDGNVKLGPLECDLEQAPGE